MAKVAIESLVNLSIEKRKKDKLIRKKSFLKKYLYDITVSLTEEEKFQILTKIF